MKVMVATNETQGMRSSDYHWCVEGELIWIQEPCGRDIRREPKSCGCGRGFAGLSSHQATTTAKIVELDDFTMDDYVLALRQSLADGGWPVEWAEDIAEEQTEFAAGWRVGTVLERDLDLFSARHGGLVRV